MKGPIDLLDWLAERFGHPDDDCEGRNTPTGKMGEVFSEITRLVFADMRVVKLDFMPGAVTAIHPESAMAVACMPNPFGWDQLKVSVYVGQWREPPDDDAVRAWVGPRHNAPLGYEQLHSMCKLEKELTYDYVIKRRMLLPSYSVESTRVLSQPSIGPTAWMPRAEAEQFVATQILREAHVAHAELLRQLND